MNNKFEIFNTNISIPNLDSLKENSFNAVRLFCCLLVIVGHCLDISGIQFRFRSIIDMHISVCIFFILSGFWVTKSFLGSKNIKEYAIKRIKKLLPLYYFSVFLFAIICAFFSTLNVQQYFTSSHFWKYIFWNCCFLNFVCPSLPGVFENAAINGALWTIKVEIGFYVILPILIFILNKINSKKKQNIFLIIIYILFVLWSELLGKFSSVLHIPAQFAHQLPGFMSFFVMGMLFLLNWDKLISKKNYFIIPSILIFALHYFTKTEILMPCALAGILMWLGTSLPCLKRIGVPVDYSYGMYLFHFPLANIFTHLQLFNVNFVWGMITTIAISFMLAFLSEKYIQFNFNRRMK